MPIDVIRINTEPPHNYRLIYINKTRKVNESTIRQSNAKFKPIPNPFLED